MVGGADPF